MRTREPQKLLAAVHRGRVTSPVRHEQATTSTRTWRALPIHETGANTGHLARASRGRLRWTRRSGTSRLLDVADEGALSSTHAPQSHAVTRAAIATPLHPPPASGSGSSLAKEHVAEEHVRVGVAERCSAACAGARRLVNARYLICSRQCSSRDANRQAGARRSRASPELWELP